MSQNLDKQLNFERQKLLIQVEDNYKQRIIFKQIDNYQKAIEFLRVNGIRYMYESGDFCSWVAYVLPYCKEQTRKNIIEYIKLSNKVQEVSYQLKISLNNKQITIEDFNNKFKTEIVDKLYPWIGQIEQNLIDEIQELKNKESTTKNIN